MSKESSPFDGFILDEESLSNRLHRMIYSLIIVSPHVPKYTYMHTHTYKHHYTVSVTLWIISRAFGIQTPQRWIKRISKYRVKGEEILYKLPWQGYTCLRLGYVHSYVCVLFMAILSP